MPKRVASGEPITATYCLGNKAPKKRRSGGEPLATVSYLTGQGMEPRNVAPIAISLPTSLTWPGFQAALEEAEGAIENEESKVLRLQIEIAQIKQDFERRLNEKEEEIDNAR